MGDLGDLSDERPKFDVPCRMAGRDVPWPCIETTTLPMQLPS